MINKFLFLILITVTPLLSYSQRDNFEYKRGYKDGFHKACGCSDPISNINRINKIGYYNDGYSDGNIDGRIYGSNKNNTPQDNYKQFGNYKQDVTPMKQAFDYKTRLLNERRGELNNVYGMIEDKIKEIGYSRNLTQSELDFISNWKSTMTKIENSDLTNNVNWNNVTTYLVNVSEIIGNW